MKLMPNCLLMGMAGCNGGQKKEIILHITLSSNHQKFFKKKKVVSRERQRVSSTERRWGKGEREKIESVRE